MHYDIIIVGGSMVGATLAVALSKRQALNIALIEAHNIPTISADDPADSRVSALTPVSKYLLTTLSIWQYLISERIGHFSDMKVWETVDSILHFDSADINAPLLGYIIENCHLQQASLQRCQELDNIKLLCPNKAIAFNGNVLELADGQTITADLIIAADGAQSPLRKWADISLHSQDYKQSAVVCTVTTEKPHQNTAWQHFLPGGPLALLPLSDPHTCAVVWSSISQEADLLIKLDDDSFKNKLDAAFDNKLGASLAVSERACFPLTSHHADCYVKDRFALVGDAAHAIHPLAGQGVNIGLLDAATLAEIVLTAQQKGRQIGSLHTLKKYQRRRRGDNLIMQITMDAFKYTFNSTWAPIRWMRQRGLNSVNQSTLLKTFFMRQASKRRLTHPDIFNHSS